MVTNQSDELTLADIIRPLTEHWRLVLVVTLVSAVLGSVVALILTPIFRAEVLLTPSSEERAGGLSGLAGDFSGLASLAGLSLGSGGRKDEAIATLQSRALTDAFVTERNLLPVLFDDKWDGDTKSWKVEGKQVPTLWDAYKLFSRDIRRVTEDKRTGLVRLTVDWKDGQLAAAWANELVAKTNAMLRQRAIQRSERNIAYVEQQLGKVGVLEVREALYRLLEAEYKNVMLAQGTDEYAFKVIDPAVVPKEKHRPSRTLIAFGATALGLFGSAFLIILLGASKRH